MTNRLEPRAVRKLAWEGSMDVRRVAQLREELRLALEAADAVSVELHKVTGMDLAGLQLLCSARRSARDAGKRFELSGEMPKDLCRILQSAGAGGPGGCGNECGQGCLWRPDRRTPNR